MGMPAWRYYTVADLLELPEDGNRYEVLHGALLVTPAPRKVHQRTVLTLARRIADFLDRYPVGEVYPGGDVQKGPGSLVIPDLLVHDSVAAGIDSWNTGRVPLLVVEVISPSTAENDRFRKRRFYQELGVPLYWLVDPDARVVEVWTPEGHFPATEHEEIRWHPEGAAEPLVIRLAELFREV